jgi:hypothetical protein
MRLVLDSKLISTRFLSFSAGTPILIGDKETHGIDSYLGLHTFVGKSRNKTFQFIKEKVWNKLNNWKVKFLSQAGK